MCGRNSADAAEVRSGIACNFGAALAMPSLPRRGRLQGDAQRAGASETQIRVRRCAGRRRHPGQKVFPNTPLIGCRSVDRKSAAE